MNNNQLLTETQAAELAQVKPKTIADWGRAGKLPRVRLSARCIRYRASDVQAMIDTSLQQGLSDTIQAHAQK
jgi:predicted site-specific integrase-resolvase